MRGEELWKHAIAVVIGLAGGAGLALALRETVDRDALSGLYTVLSSSGLLPCHRRNPLALSRRGTYWEEGLPGKRDYPKSNEVGYGPHSYAKNEQAHQTRRSRSSMASTG